MLQLAWRAQLARATSARLPASGVITRAGGDRPFAVEAQAFCIPTSPPGTVETSSDPQGAVPVSQIRRISRANQRRLCRVGHRRVTLSHVSCAPSSNWTCGFPASSSPTIFFRRRAPQARQMAHPSYHSIQPTPFIQELIVPVLPSRPPTTLVFASEP